jgi:hypothetical protein
MLGLENGEGSANEKTGAINPVRIKISVLIMELLV